MSFQKETVFALNTDNTEVLSPDLVKTASFSLPEHFEFNPEYLYLKVKSVSAGEWWGCNKNSDFFPEAELKPNYRTFLSAHVFKNHENKLIEGAIGDILTATWDDKMKCVVLLIRIDRKVAPTIVRGFEKGFMTDVSMGCRIDYSICSICGNKAKTKMDYCDHIKYQRGKVLDDGRKVYEINISPKFHDISAVLNGAERSAKVVDMKLLGADNNPVQSQNSSLRLLRVADSDETSMEKAASFGELPKRKEVPFYSPQIKLASIHDKIASMNKMSDIQKEIEGNIINSSISEYTDEKYKKLGNMIDTFKILYTKFLDGEECYKIGESLRMISDKNLFSDSTIFSKFLSLADSCGIEFSPLEIFNIYNGLRGEKGKITDNPIPDIDSINSPSNIIDCINHACSRNIPHGVTASKIISVMPKLGKFHNSLLNARDPSSATKVTIMRITPKSQTNTELPGSVFDSISEIISPLLQDRSMRNPFAGRRVVKIAEENIQPNYKNLKQFLPVLFSHDSSLIKTASDLDILESEYLWEVHQNESIGKMSTEKVASEEKTAVYIPKSLGGKAIVVGIPATIAYSALQRSRIRNGKRVSDFNRAIAEHPTEATIAQYLILSSANKYAKPAAKAIAHGIKQLGHKDTWKSVGRWFKDASDNVENMEKIGKKNSDVYKMAMLLKGDKKDDMADNILREINAEEKDLENYLHLIKNSIKIELDNNEDLQKDLALSKVSSEDGLNEINLIDAGILSLVDKILNK